MQSDNNTNTRMFNDNYQNMSYDRPNENTMFFETTFTPQVIIKIETGSPSEYVLKNNEFVAIGRQSQSGEFAKPDIRVEDPFVSRGHHVIVKKSNDFVELYVKEGKTGLKMDDKQYEMNDKISNLEPPINFKIGESTYCSIEEVKDPEKTKINFNVPFPSANSPNNQTKNQNGQTCKPNHNIIPEPQYTTVASNNAFSNKEEVDTNTGKGLSLFDEYGTSFGPDIDAQKQPKKSNVNSILLIVVISLILLLLGLTLFLVLPKFQYELTEVSADTPEILAIDANNSLQLRPVLHSNV
jgi:hypothetical protein